MLANIFLMTLWRWTRIFARLQTCSNGYSGHFPKLPPEVYSILRLLDQIFQHVVEHEITCHLTYFLWLCDKYNWRKNKNDGKDRKFANLEH